MREVGPLCINHSTALLKVTRSADASNNISVASAKRSDPGD